MKPWSPEEDDVLRAASASRWPLAEIVERLGRTPTAVRGRARALNLGIGVRRAYSADEERQLRILAKQGKHYHEIAEALGLSVQSVKTWCQRHGITVRHMNPRWTDEDRKLVAATVRDTVDQLAARLNRSPRAVLHQFLRAGMLYTKMLRPIRKTRPKAA